MSSLQHQHKFQTLDAVRGIAAILVVIHHGQWLIHWLPARGYLAVDLFFALSGFVLSHAYQARLDMGMPTKAFLSARVQRLAPLYLLALVIGILASWFLGVFQSLHLGWAEYVEYVVFSMFLLPVHSAAHHQVPMFPFDPPCWTLFLEIVMNVVHGFLLRRLALKTLVFICGMSGIFLLTAFAHERSMNIGWDWPGVFHAGLARVLFSYTAGMLVFRIWQKRPLAVKIPASLLLIITALVLMVQTPHEAIVSLLLTMLVFPCVIYLSALNEPSYGLQRTFGLLGATSYALYVIHSPLSMIFGTLWHSAEAFTPWSGILLMILLIAAALALDAYYDVPVRRFLRKYQGRRVKVAAS